MKRSPEDRQMRNLMGSLWLLVGLVAIVTGLLISMLFFQRTSSNPAVSESVVPANTIAPDTNFVNLWQAPSDWRMMRLAPDEQKKVLYGKELITRTAEYLGPNGSVLPLSNGMNCQNCHLSASTQPWGNNYAAVQANYPKFRERSGRVENQAKRVNDCFQRSLNGQPLDSTSRKMQSIPAYIRWLGTDVPIKTIPRGTGIFKLKSLKRAAAPEDNLLVYTQKCQSCHQATGEGVLTADGRSYAYPPLWGQHSYNVGAGLYRISNLAGYVKYNMPLGTTYERPQLSDEEAWDVAAYINSQPRPSVDISHDWPNVAGEPFDHPFGPYTDPFSEEQHKYGPYKPIKDWKQTHKKENVRPSGIQVTIVTERRQRVG